MVKGDIRGNGSPEKVQTIVNTYLAGIRNQLEDATRLALIYTCSFMKLVPNAHPDPFKRISVSAVAPWDVIVDTDATSWSDQKFIGHRYFLTIADAKKKYGNKKFATHSLLRFLDQGTELEETGYRESNTNDDMVFEYVEIVEFYDLENDHLMIWSPDYKNCLLYTSPSPRD